MELAPVIPNYALKDTTALLTVLLALPASLSSPLLLVYILASLGSRWAVSWASKLLLNSNSNSNSNGQPPTTIVASTRDKQDETHPGSNFSALMLMLLSDVLICIALKLTGPLMTKVAYVVAKAIVAGSLCGGDWISVSTASAAVLAADKLFALTSDYVAQNLELSINSQHSLFPIFSTNFHVSSFFIGLFSRPDSHFQLRSYESYKAVLFLCLQLLLDFFHLLLAIHIVLIAFASVFRNNFFSRSVNHLCLFSSDPPTHVIHPVLLKDRTRDPKLLTVQLSQDQADTKFVVSPAQQSQTSLDEAPASYPETTEPSDGLSSRNIVADNFVVFCTSFYSRAKNSSKLAQPLWSFVATLKAMSLRKDIYSGEIEANQGDNNSLVLSDYVNKYDDYKFANFDEGFKWNKITIFVNYIGETLISFQFKNYTQGTIIIRVNGVIWYQVSRGEHNGEEYLIVGGLTPLSQYDVQFIIEEKDDFGNKKKYLIDDLIISTVDKDGGNISTAKTTSNKVLSPLVTLQESLITTSDNLNQEKLKLKKQRKEISKKLNAYRQEIDKLKSKISTSDSNDLKNWNKVSALRASVKQAEEDVSKIEADILEFDTKETEIHEVYLVEKRKFEQHLRNFQNFKSNYNSKMEGERTKLSELNVELDTLNTKRDKLQTKLERFTTELNKVSKELESLYKSDLTARITARQSRTEKRVSLLGEFSKEIEKMKGGCMGIEQENEILRIQLKTQGI